MCEPPERKYEQRRKIDKERPRDGEEVEGSQEASEEVGRKGGKISGGEENNERNEETDSVLKAEIEESGEEREGLQISLGVPDTSKMWEQIKSKNK